MSDFADFHEKMTRELRKKAEHQQHRDAERQTLERNRVRMLSEMRELAQFVVAILAQAGVAPIPYLADASDLAIAGVRHFEGHLWPIGRRFALDTSGIYLSSAKLDLAEDPQDCGSYAPHRRLCIALQACGLRPGQPYCREAGPMDFDPESRDPFSFEGVALYRDDIFDDFPVPLRTFMQKATADYVYDELSFLRTRANWHPGWNR